MKTMNEKIAEFLGIPVEGVETIDPDTYNDMKKLVEKEDFFNLHQLGYAVDKAALANNKATATLAEEKIWFVECTF